MTSSLFKELPRRAVVLVSVCLSGCVLDYQVGKNPLATASDDDSGSSSTTTPGPAVCGDGSVDGDEACDDGNDVADDGCDLECRPSANVEWVHKDREADVVAVAVDPSGRIVLAGWENNEALVRVLNPDGALVWERKVLTSGFDYARFSDVVVAGDGRIFAAGHENVPHDAELLIQGFGPDGEVLWTAHESFLSNQADVPVLALGPGGLYVANSALQSDDTRPLIVRRLDPATGAVQWNIHHGDARLTAGDLAVSGSALVAVGSISETEGDPRHPLVVVLDEQGAVVSSAADEQVDGLWFSVAPIGGAGDLILAGLDASVDINGYGAVLRRVRADGTEVWSFTDEETTEQFHEVAVGPDEAIVVIGTGRVPDSPAIYSYARRLTGQGAPVWSSHFLNTAEATREQGYAAAFGPGFIVALGQWDEGPIGDEVDNWAMWVRRLSSE